MAVHSLLPRLRAFSSVGSLQGQPPTIQVLWVSLNFWASELEGMSSCDHTVNNFHGGGQPEVNGCSVEGGLSESRALKPAPAPPRYPAQQPSPSPQEHKALREGVDLPGTLQKTQHRIQTRNKSLMALLPPYLYHPVLFLPLTFFTSSNSFIRYLSYSSFPCLTLFFCTYWSSGDFCSLFFPLPFIWAWDYCHKIYFKNKWNVIDLVSFMNDKSLEINTNLRNVFNWQHYVSYSINIF